MNNSNSFNRRKFLKTTAAGTAAVSLGMAGLSALLPSFIIPPYTLKGANSTGFDQQPLPYKYNELEDVIDKLTMEIHYSKHAAAYSKNLKEAAIDEGIDEKTAVEQILGSISKYSAKLRNNAGGHFNHEMFWQNMRPKTKDNKPGGHLAEAIKNSFTSFENFKTQFSEAALKRFGSGWAWLYMRSDKGLKIGSTPNQDNPLMDLSEIKGIPLLSLDVWEHAYYLKYQNRRAEYINNWWNVVNWENVEQRFEI